MKKLTILIFAFLLMALLVSCDTARAEVVAYDGIAHFNYSQTNPEIILHGTQNDRIVEDESFFLKLVRAIDEKTITDDLPCDCEAMVVSIDGFLFEDGYYFIMHDHGIFIFSFSNDLRKCMDYIGYVECDDETMNELFAIFEEVD